MSKLISNPTECGYCDISPNFRADICRHPKTPLLKCPPDKFPDFCPLQTGYSIAQIIKDHPLMEKRLTKPKRRDRTHCISYNTQPGLGCSHKDIMYTICKGVNCGHFEPKTK